MARLRSLTIAYIQRLLIQKHRSRWKTH